MSFKADLHCHTTCSDGSLTPSELLQLAQNSGLTGLSITDHDSIEAYQEALPLANQMGIKLISGVEFSTQFKTTSVHILGYGIDLADHDLIAFLLRHKKRRLERNLEILEKLKKEGMLVSEEELLNTDSNSIGRPHIAKILVEKGYVPSVMKAFHRYLGDGKKCYSEGKPFTIEETLEIIKKAHGVAVLAHPHLYHSRTFVKEVLKFPFDGMECVYANMPESKNAFWIELAKQKNLLITAGSDFHGSMKPDISLGASTLDSTHFQKLLDALL